MRCICCIFIDSHSTRESLLVRTQYIHTLSLEALVIISIKSYLEVPAGLIFKKHQCPRGQDRKISIHVYLPRLYNVSLFNALYTSLNRKVNSQKNQTKKCYWGDYIFFFSRWRQEIRTRDDKPWILARHSVHTFLNKWNRLPIK